MTLVSAGNRVLFVAAIVLFVVAVAEKVANVAGYTMVGMSYTPGRLLEFAAIMVLFVIALLLREIRDRAKT